MRTVFEQIALDWSTVAGAYIVLLVFGMLRYIDDVVEVLASIGDSPTTDLQDESDSS